MLLHIFLNTKHSEKGASIFHNFPLVQDGYKLPLHI